jgi:hypothetical protein
MPVVPAGRNGLSDGTCKHPAAWRRLTEKIPQESITYEPNGSIQDNHGGADYQGRKHQVATVIQVIASPSGTLRGCILSIQTPGQTAEVDRIRCTG